MYYCSKPKQKCIHYTGFRPLSFLSVRKSNKNICETLCRYCDEFTKLSTVEAVVYCSPAVSKALDRKKKNLVIRLLVFYVLTTMLQIFLSVLYLSLFPFCISFVQSLSFYLFLRSCIFNLFYCSPKLPFPIYLPFPIPSLPHLSSPLLQNLVFTALSCQLKMKSRLCFLPALSHLACYFASFDSLSSCPRIRLAEKGPNTALYYYLTLMKLVMYAAEKNLKAFPVRVFGECLIYLQHTWDKNATLV